jgi:two-component system sensor histidine kinase VicK
MVWMATDKISRVLYNLLDNALRYTPEGGQVCVDVRPQEDAVLVSVEDSGAGIPPEDIPHVFDRFYRVEKSRSRAGYQRGGTGLGLAIAKGIVRAHGGEMWVESEVGQGTKVCFTLPDH